MWNLSRGIPPAAVVRKQLQMVSEWRGVAVCQPILPLDIKIWISYKFWESELLFFLFFSTFKNLKRPFLAHGHTKIGGGSLLAIPLAKISKIGEPLQGCFVKKCSVERP